MNIEEGDPKKVGEDLVFFFSSRRRHTRLQGDWSSDVCSSDLIFEVQGAAVRNSDSHDSESCVVGDLARYCIQEQAARGIRQQGNGGNHESPKREIGRASCRERV